MKKVLNLLIVSILVLILFGCSSQESVKTEEELKAEIRAEIEAEMKTENDNDNDEDQNQNIQEQTVNTSVNTNEKNYTVHKIEDLSNGDKVGDMTVENLDYIVGGDTVYFDLVGYAVVNGNIVVDEMYGDYLVIVEDTYTFDETIEISMPSGYTYEFDLDYLYLSNPEILTYDQKQQIQNGEYVGGKIGINKVTHLAKDQSEKSTSCDIESIF